MNVTSDVLFKLHCDVTTVLIKLTKIVFVFVTNEKKGDTIKRMIYHTKKKFPRMQKKKCRVARMRTFEKSGQLM